ncbi:MAG: hypothetical protein JW863_08365 [Chitinispirillaceae bacterium]|nr:hypothetical protein [Chitinispirillaceae bacterium]
MKEDAINNAVSDTDTAYFGIGKKSVSIGVLFYWVVYAFSWSAYSTTDTVTLQNWSFLFTESDSSIHYAVDNDSIPAEKIQVPHSYNLNESLGNHKDGFGWYSTTVKIQYKDDADYVLESDGVCLRAKIFIDGEYAGESRHAYLPFTINITRFLLNKKEVRITIRVDNRLMRNDFPDHNCNGWWIYGGLVRSVRLLALPRKRIDNCRLRTRYVSDSTFKLSVSYDSKPTSPDSMILSVVSPKKKTILEYRFTGRACTVTVGKVTAWTPDHPYLYDIELTPYWDNVPGEPFQIKRGFSQLHIVDGALHLNGKPVFLRGFGRHDVTGNKGPLLTRKERCVDLATIKSTGANMLRIAHFPQHPDVYELCDSLGLIVMDEMPAWKSYPGFIGNEEGQKRASEYMKSLIDAHGNHTCIGLWCIANEIHSVKNRVALYVKYLSDFTRTTDPTRLVTYTSFNYQFDKAYEYVDVVSVNEYFGWYFGSIAMLPSLFKAIRKECPGKPMIITEFGASSAAGLHNPEARLPGPVESTFKKDYSENFQALFHEKQIEAIRSNRDICNGAVVWCYNDFMEYRKKPNDKDLPAGLNGMGIVTNDRKKKMAFDIIQKSFCRIQNEMNSARGY